MLLNRKTAWLITALVMITGLFIGSYTSYLQMRAPLVEVFRTEVEPILNEKLQLVHNMLTLYRLNAPDNNEVQDFIQRVMLSIESVQDEIELVRCTDSALLPDRNPYMILMQYAAELERRGQGPELSESDAARMRNLYTDLQEIIMILSQSGYNDMALAFNTATTEGLGFLTHNRATQRILRNYGMLPVFFY